MSKSIEEVVADLIIEVTYQGRLLKDQSESNLRMLETLRLLSGNVTNQQTRMEALEQRLVQLEKRLGS